MTVEDLCRKLKPIIRGRAERYWMAYLAGDAVEKQEIELALRVLDKRHFGSSLDTISAHLTVPEAALAAGPYELGDVLLARKASHPFGLREDEMVQHVAVFGRSGAGKTNTVIRFIKSLVHHGKPFLIFDWKRNYRDLLGTLEADVYVYTVGRSTVPLAFNPLIPPEGTEPAVWLKKLIEIIAHSYYLGEGVMFLLQEALHAVYTQFGVYRGRIKRYPTFADVLRWLQEHPVKGRQALWMDSAMRGIRSICFGHMGEVVNTRSPGSLGELLTLNVILELDGLSNADKTLITQSMLLWIHHYRMAQPEREEFRHAILIEEAHHILRKQAAGGAETVTETVLREIRELGEGILLVDQHPSMISIPALGNTYCTIAMNLKHRSDVSAIAAAMLMKEEEQDILGELPIGEAVVKLQGRHSRPFQIRIPHMKIAKGSVNDASLIQRMTALTGMVPSSAPEDVSAKDLPAITEEEQRLLLDLSEYPLSGVVERYKRLGVSRRRGNEWKESCLAKDLLLPVHVPTRSGKVVLLQLSRMGVRVLEQRGVEVSRPSRWGGIEHEFWKHKIAEHLTQLGWNVSIEETDEGFPDAFTDLVVRNEGTSIAIEVETGKSDWRANITKNLKKRVDRIMVAVTQEEQVVGIRETARVEFGNVCVLPAWRFIELRFADDLTADWQPPEQREEIPPIPPQFTSKELSTR